MRYLVGTFVILVGVGLLVMGIRLRHSARTVAEDVTELHAIMRAGRAKLDRVNVLCPVCRGAYPLDNGAGYGVFVHVLNDHPESATAERLREAITDED